MRSVWTYIVIYFLTVFDICATYSGMKYGFISEANPLMEFLISRYHLFSYAVILAGLAIALYFFYRVRAKVKWISEAMLLILAVKVSVALLHLYWITELFSCIPGKISFHRLLP